MRAVIQRVSKADVRVNDELISEINAGLLTLLGIAKNDTEEQMQKLVQKIVELRIFEDENGKMNRSLRDIGGSHLIVSQFTLAGDTSSGKRPSFINAERPEIAKGIYEKALQFSSGLGVHTTGGIFQADMKITLINDGPVTFVLDA
jgi:D-tyrosyl-tRNA(Tyr) deacylase